MRNVLGMVLSIAVFSSVYYLMLEFTSYLAVTDFGYKLLSFSNAVTFIVIFIALLAVCIISILIGFLMLSLCKISRLYPAIVFGIFVSIEFIISLVMAMQSGNPLFIKIPTILTYIICAYLGFGCINAGKKVCAINCAD